MSTSRELIEHIHAAGRQMVLAITGGGSRAIAELLEVPGGSATVLEALVPYSATALDDWLGGPVDHYCSERTARAMAMAAFERARELSANDPHQLCGIGATASLVSNRPKRGPHRIHVAWQTAERTSVASCELVKGARTRSEEEAIATQLVLNAATEACGLRSHTKPLAGPTEPVVHREQAARPTWMQLLLGERTHVGITSQSGDLKSPPTVLFPGAFNPLHAGHRRMAQVAADRLGLPITFELSITNVDKPPLDFIEIADRLAQFSGEQVLLTRAPRFVEKARIAPGCTFVVGVDTITRIGNAKYYGGGIGERDAALVTLRDAGCGFLVFGRYGNGSFCTLSGVELPPILRDLCEEVSEAEFRDDISSTALRER